MQMPSHAPVDYPCPFCFVAQGIENEHTWTKQQDIVYRDDTVMAFICASWWPKNPGHVLIIPNQHFENVYTMPTPLLARIQEVAREISIGFKETNQCDGVSTRQHNEPAGNQDVWHYHLHVFPRWENDGLYLERRQSTTPQQRQPYAEKLRAWLCSRLD
ncbi:MAG: HIT domain-containing protein [Candidatus Latescibacteria bacterium]|nr:HIT domain-containing protein [Candidatus Latescibacterota bacterium]